MRDAVKDICGEELAAEVSRVAVELYSQYRCWITLLITPPSLTARLDLQPRLRLTPKLEESSLRTPNSNSVCYQQPQNLNRFHRDSS